MFRISNNRLNYRDILLQKSEIEKKYNEFSEDNKNKESQTTIVTAYYNIKSKFPSGKYLSWMENFLRIPCHLVVFTDENSYNIIKNFRKRYNLEEKTYIILKKIEEFHNYQYIDYYRYSHSIDRENGYHSPELYMIWNEKSYFVKEALSINPFHSEWFFWTDIGCVRNYDMLSKIFSYPNDNKINNLDKEKMNLICIENFRDNDFSLDERGVPNIFKNREGRSCSDIVRVQGGFFGGHINCWERWIEKFEDILKVFMESKTFIGKDQYLMASVYIKNKDQVNLLYANKDHGDPWFYFLYHFS